MNMVAMDPKEKATLLETPEEKAAPKAPVIVEVARKHGVSPLRQMRETFALRFGPRKLQSKEYYDNELYDPLLTMAEKKEFVGTTANTALNARLSPPELVPTRAFVGNKVLYTALLNQLGLAATETQAMASTHRSLGAIPVLRDAETIEEFLRHDARYPLFCKPQHGSLSEGSVRIEAYGSDVLHLANGQTVSPKDFAEEVMQKYKGGFLFQTALTPHPQMAAITGQAIGCVRVVTVMEEERARPLYGVWKIPSPRAMSDNFWQAGSMLAHLSLDDGRVLACRRGMGPETEEVGQHPVSGAQITGFEVPLWTATLDLARQAHAVFPEFGVCGWDIAITEKGPCIVECNDNPFHTLYQLAAKRGILNDEFAPVWDAVESRQKARLKRQRQIGKDKKRGRK